MRLVLLVLAVAACGKKADAPNAGSASQVAVSHGEAAVAKMADLKSQACACKTKECATAVSAAVKKWSADDLKANGALKLSEEQGERMAKIAGDMGACVEAAIGPPPHAD
jgi:hypothetical protein